MRWHHEVNVRWLLARQDALTASDVVSLIPEYKRWSKHPDEISPGCAALWGEKHCDVDLLDTTSFNAAARGHIMEPYAVQDYSISHSDICVWHHWDDVLITQDPTPDKVPLAFSPDAMDIKPPRRGNKLQAAALSIANPKSILEIKSYEPAKHMKSMIADNKDTPERYQIAVAMCVLPSIEEGRLVFYCPMITKFQMFHKIYKREDLKEEMDLVNNIWNMYNYTVSKLNDISCGMKANVTMRQVYEDMLEDEMQIFTRKK